MLVMARWSGVVDVRGLSVLPVLVGVLLTFVFELLGIDGAGGYRVDPTRHQSSVKTIAPSSMDDGSTHLAPGKTRGTSLFRLCNNPPCTALFPLA